MSEANDLGNWLIKCTWLVLGYFPDLPRNPLEVRGEAPGIIIVQYSGIKRDMTLVDKLIPSDDAQNYPLFGLQLLDETFGHSTKWTNK